jgi:hypothetical protein
MKLAVFGGGGLLVFSCFLCSGGTAIWYFAIRNTQPDYYPLKEGSKWEYDSEIPIDEGFGRGIKAKKVTSVTRIEGTEIINGKSYFKAVYIIPGASTTNYFRKDHRGVHCVNKTHIELGEVLVMPEPPNIKEKWTEMDQRSSLEGEEDVHLLDQTYKQCLKVRSTVLGKDGFRATVDKYYAPNVGLVQEITILYQGNIQTSCTVQTLKKYTP